VEVGEPLLFGEREVVLLQGEQGFPFGLLLLRGANPRRFVRIDVGAVRHADEVHGGVPLHPARGHDAGGEVAGEWLFFDRRPVLGGAGL